MEKSGFSKMHHYAMQVLQIGSQLLSLANDTDIRPSFLYFIWCFNSCWVL